MAGTEDVPGEEAEVVEGTAVAKADAAEAAKPAGRKRRRRATIKTIADMRLPMAGLLQSPTMKVFRQLQATADLYARLAGPGSGVRALTEPITAGSVFSENTLLKFQGALDSGKGLATLFDSIDRLQSSQRGTELAFTSAVAELTKSGPVIAWRNSLLTQHHVDFGIKPALGLVDGVLVGKLAGVSEQARMLTSWAAHYEALPNLISPLGAEAVTAWRGQVLALPEVPPRLNLGRSVASGVATLGIASLDMLTTEDLDEGQRHEVADEVEREALEPWESGRLKVGRDLRSLIGQLDPTTSELLDGAWDDLSRRGPAAAVKAATCMIEVLDRVLRAAAPDAAVVAWHQAGNRSMKEWDNVDPKKGHPPHSMRVLYLMRDRDDMEQLKLFLTLRSQTRSKLQSIKHASEGDVVTVRALTMTVEALLTGLLLDD